MKIKKFVKKKIEKINIKTFSIVGIIFVIINFVSLFLTPSPESEEFNWFETLLGLFLLGTLLYLFIFSIINLFKARKIPSVLGIVLSLLTFILYLIGAFRFYSKNELTLLSIGQDILFLFTIIFLGFFSVISFLKSVFEPVIEVLDSNSKKGKIFKKFLLMLKSILLALFLTMFVRIFIFQPFTIGNDGLQPYLNRGDYAVFQEINKSPQKGDIVITKTPRGNIVSLVIGLEGDKIELKNGTFFVNEKALENVVYDFDQANGLDKITQRYFIVVPKGYFYGIPTVFKEKEVNLSIFLYEKDEIIGKLIFPKRKISLEKYTGPDSCNGYPPISCPEDSRYYCPPQGKPFCCKEEPIEGFCIECPPGQKLALGRNQEKMCCREDLICNNICYSECSEGEIFRCDPMKGGVCEISKCPPGEILALASDKKTKMCCKKEYVCKGICYSECPPDQVFKCDPQRGGICELIKCPEGEDFALGADKKTKICCKKEYICQGICYTPCPSGEVFRCDPEIGAYCE